MDNYQQLLSNPFKWLTREMRTQMALCFIPSKETHVDLGCGQEQYLLKKSPCLNKIGYDRQLGQFLKCKVPHQDKSVDCVTMLAVIEHLDFPLKIIRECHRILKDDGVFIITTPKAQGAWVMKLYDPHYEQREGKHQQYFDYGSMLKLLSGYFSVNNYKTFAFGFNQLFVCSKISKGI